jgi:ADP-ribose pyrophosphatase YjhB (NUDIX family)
LNETFLRYKQLAFFSEQFKKIQTMNRIITETTQMTELKIRPMVLTLVHRNNEILVSKGQYLEHGQPYYRPLGGGIDFGESSQKTVAREMVEEINVPLKNIEFLEVIEVFFESQGETPRHHIIFLYRAEFLNESDYEVDKFEIEEDYFTETVFAEWKPVELFISGEMILHPKPMLKWL